jgi:hypothetical protein
MATEEPSVSVVTESSSTSLPSNVIIDTSLIDNNSIIDSMKKIEYKMRDRSHLLNTLLLNNEYYTSSTTLTNKLKNASSNMKNLSRLSKNNNISNESSDYPTGNKFLSNSYGLYIKKGILDSSSLSFRCVYYGNNIWVGGSYSNGLFYSTDGIHWTQSNITSGSFRDLKYGGSKWVAAEDVVHNGVYYSTDGKTWYKTSITDGGYYAVEYYNGTWVVGSSNPYTGLWYSTDGINFTQSNVTDAYIIFISHHNSVWLAGTYNSKGLYYSDNGITWTNCISSGNFAYAANYGNRYVAVGYTGNGLYYSYNGKTWTKSNSYTSYSFSHVLYGESAGLFIAAGGDNGLFYSTDYGVTWKQSNVSGVNIAPLCYNGDKFLAGGGSKGLYYSIDGMNWYQTNITSGGIYSIYYANNTWVIGTNSNGIYYSKHKIVDCRPLGTQSAYEYYFPKLSEYTSSNLKSSATWLTTTFTDKGVCKNCTIYGTNSSEFKSYIAGNTQWRTTTTLLYSRSDDSTLIDISDYVPVTNSAFTVLANDYYYILKSNSCIYISTNLINWYTPLDKENKNYDGAIVDNNGRIICYHTKYATDMAIINPPTFEIQPLNIPIFSQYTTIGYKKASNSNISVTACYKGTITYIVVASASEEYVLELGDSYNSTSIVEVPRVVEGTVRLDSAVTRLENLDFTPDKALITIRNGYSSSKLDNGVIIASKNYEFKRKHDYWFTYVGQSWYKSNITSGWFNGLVYANNIWVAGSWANTGIYYSIDGKYWYRSNLTSGSFFMVVFYNGLFLAGGNDNQGIKYSYDGKTWNDTNQTTGYFGSISYNRITATYVAAEVNNKGLYYSTDGKTWSKSNVTSGIFNTIIYKFGENVAGYNGGIYSGTGSNWTKASGVTSTVYQITYGANYFVAATSTGLYYATSASSWTASNVTSITVNYVVYGGGRFVAGTTSHGTYYSINGTSWTQSSSCTSYTATALQYIDRINVWVAAFTNNYIYYSTDGAVTWTSTYNCNNVFRFAYNHDGTLVATTKAGFLYSTYNTKNFTNKTKNKAALTPIDTKYEVPITFTKSNKTGTFRCVHYGNGIWTAAIDSNGLWYSENNGVTWNQSNITSGTYYCIDSSESVIVASCGTGNTGLYYSADGKTWTQTNITSNNWHEVHYANGIWVTVSFIYLGFYYSTDGITWTRSSSYTTADFYSLGYGNGLWVAGSSGYSSNYGLYYSSDGITWTKSSSCTSYYFYDVYYGMGIWVAASVGNGLFYSTDGKTWNQSNITSNNWGCVHYGNGMWVAGSNTADVGVYYSTSGITWYKAETISAGSFGKKALYYGNGMWVISSSSDYAVYYSYDGITWFKCSGVSGNYGVCYANNTWIVSGYYSNNESISANIKTSLSHMDSTDYSYTNNFCKKWYQTTITTGSWSVGYGNGMWVAAGTTGIMYSHDGICWYQSDTAYGSYSSVCYGYDSVWIVCKSNGGGIYYSVDNGIHWILSNVTTNIYNLSYGNGIFIAGGSSYSSSNYSNGVWWSEDGMYWYQSNLTSQDFTVARFANGMWHIGSSFSYHNNSNGLYYSYDGKTWKKTSITYGDVSPDNDNYGLGLFVACDGYYGPGGMFYSEDGINYTKATGISGTRLGYVSFANNMFFVGAYEWQSYGLFYSTDGKIWNKTNITTTGLWRLVYYKNGLYITNDGTGVRYSTDGKTWTVADSSLPRFGRIVFHDEIAVANTNGSGLYYSMAGDATSYQNHINRYKNTNNNAFIDGNMVQINVDSDYIGAYADYTLIGRKVTENSLGISTKVDNFIK